MTLERFTLAEATTHGSSAGLTVFRASVLEQSLGTEVAPKLNTYKDSNWGHDDL